MNNGQFPTQHTVTVTRTTVDPVVFQYNSSYFKTLYGKLKLAEMVTSLLAFIIVSTSQFALTNRATFFTTVAGLAFWWTCILIIFYAFRVIDKFDKIPWMQVEIISCILFAGFFFLASIFLIAHIISSVIFLFAGIAGTVAMIIFGYDAYLKLITMQSNQSVVVHTTNEFSETRLPSNTGYCY